MTHIHSMMQALAIKSNCAGNTNSPAAMAIAKFGESHQATRLLKSWALQEDSAESRAASREFLQLAARQSIIGKIDAVSRFRRAPFEMPVLQIGTGSTAAFTEEGQPIAISSMDLTAIRLKSKSIKAICPATAESARSFDLDSGISADLIRALAVAESQAFFSEAIETAAAPAGILSTGEIFPDSTYLGNIPAEDIDILIENFTGDLSRAVLVTSALNGYRLNKPHSSGNAQQFLDTGALGGTVGGLAHVTSSSIADNKIALVDPSRILLADAQGLEIDVSNYGTLGVDGTAGAIEQISLFQTNTIAYRLTREINWLAATGAVSFLAVDWSI